MTETGGFCDCAEKVLTNEAALGKCLPQDETLTTAIVAMDKKLLSSMCPMLDINTSLSWALFP